MGAASRGTGPRAVLAGFIVLLVATGLAAPSGAQTTTMTTTSTTTTTTTTVGTGPADLSVAVTGSTTRAEVGVPLDFTVVVTNAGPDPATAVTVVDDAVGATLADLPTTTVGTCPKVGFDGLLGCTIGTLAPSASATVKFTLWTFEPETLVDSATVRSSTPDPQPGNDRAEASVAVVSFHQVVVEGYFRALFHRPPTAAETTTWTQRLDFTHSFPAYVGLLTATTSYRTVWLDQQFRTYLGRPLGSSGGTYLAWLRTGRSYDDVVTALVTSSEFMARLVPPCHPGGPCVTIVKDAWVRAVYRDVTGDEISDPLVATYQGRLDAGASRAAVARAIITSAQGRRRFVDRIARQYLGRGATRFDLYINVSELLQGESPQKAEAAMLASLAFLEHFVATA